MDANVEYTLQPNEHGQPRTCLAVKLPAEVIRALAEGTNASICISTPKGGSLAVGEQQYEVTWQNEGMVDCYRSHDGQLLQVGPCVGKAVVVPRLDAPKHVEIKSRTDEALERMRKRKVEVMEIGVAVPALEARQLMAATAPLKPAPSGQAAANTADIQLQQQFHQQHQAGKKRALAKTTETPQARTTWICMHNVPIAATRQSVLDFLDGIEVKPNGVHFACWQSRGSSGNADDGDQLDPSSGVCQIFVECTKVVGAQLALQRRGEEIKIARRSKAGTGSGGGSERAVVSAIDAVSNIDLPWVRAFSVPLSDDRTPVSSVLASLVGKVPLCSLTASPVRLSQCSRLRVQQHRNPTLATQQLSQQLQHDLCPDSDVNVYMEAYQLLADVYEHLRDELLVLQSSGHDDVLLQFASKQADFMKQKWIEMFNRTALPRRSNP